MKLKVWSLSSKLSSTPMPNFEFYFPKTTVGHGLRHQDALGPAADRQKAGLEYWSPAKHEACIEGNCTLNGKNGSSHTCGRAHNALEWCREVKYNGPSHGLKAEQVREKKEPKLETVCRHCLKKEVHSTCKMAPGFKTSVGDMMVHRVGLLTNSIQDQHRLGEYAGVEVRWAPSGTR